MILTVVGYGTPVVLAYALFVGIARQLNPFSRPLEESRRPAWSLALLAGMSTWILLAVAMAVLFARKGSEVEFAIMPSVYVATSVLTATAAWYWLFGRSVQRQVAYRTTLDKARHVIESDSDMSGGENITSETTLPDNVLPAYLLNAKTGKLELEELDVAAINDCPEEETQSSGFDRKAEDTEAADVTAENRTSESEKAETRNSTGGSTDERYSAEQMRLKAAERQVLLLRQSLICAKQETRRANAARAKALGTANKAIAFARQTMQIREQLENELLLARQTLENRHTRVANLAKSIRGGHKPGYPHNLEENPKPSVTDMRRAELKGKNLPMRHKDSG